MNEDLRKATDRIEQLEKTVKGHSGILAMIVRMLAPLRRRRRRISQPSAMLDQEAQQAMKAQMASHGYPDPDDERTPDPKIRHQVGS